MTNSSPAIHNADDQRPDLPRPYKCHLCDKAFHRLEHQTRHIRTHTGEKPHACSFPGCTKRFSRSDELTRHTRIHNNPNSRRSNKQQHATAAAAALQHSGLPPGTYDVNVLQHQQQPQPSTTHPYHAIGPLAPMSHGPVTPQTYHLPPPSASASRRNSPEPSPNMHYSAAPSAPPGSYLTRNISGEISQANMHSHSRPMDMNLLATAASHVESPGPAYHHSNAHHVTPARSSRFGYQSPYQRSRMPSLSSYHYTNTSNPASQPMSRSHSQDDDDSGRPYKKSRPNSPHSTSPPSPEPPHESASPTPDHTPLATPSHSPRLRPLYLTQGVYQLPTLHHLSLQHPPALAPVEPATDQTQTYVPTQHSGLRISEIMETGDGAQRKLPIPMMSLKDTGYAKMNDLVGNESGSGRASSRASEIAEERSAN
ncbi:hypothetical protein K470DRAFT_254048 [Piedraia hortae CBS 480.64]|uniref:C2H2-type domain-containing protein n=1 Tax=Piedraia hortae CBS 480.64 TaxID=1314780 RepID=A0A6A7CAY4_9PEZI|nr:hypothetical protein K470DRAFT_254048 [Piedraia hortae CBS 480.64]